MLEIMAVAAPGILDLIAKNPALLADPVFLVIVLLMIALPLLKKWWDDRKEALQADDQRLDELIGDRIEDLKDRIEDLQAENKILKSENRKLTALLIRKNNKNGS